MRWGSWMSRNEWRDRARINAPRVRAGWATWLAELDWHTFSTLTFDPRKSPDTSDQTANLETFWWCCQVGKLQRRPVGWAYTIEGGGGGYVHAHALIAGCSEEVWPALDAIWRVRNGLIQLRRVDSPRRAVDYICKAVGLNGEIAFSDTLRRYRSNTGLGKPVVAAASTSVRP